MTNEEQTEMLIRIDERLEMVCDRLKAMPCHARGDVITRHEQQIKDHESRLNKHDKNWWFTIVSLVGLFLLALRDKIGW